MGSTNNQSFKPELLLPAGNAENFHAAIDGGADAVYLGLKKFNARGRANNFSPEQLQSIIKEAKENHIKVYVTLNTVIKNNELPELLEILDFLSKVKVSAIIIQDWGVYHLAKKYYPQLALHASTQMGNHNSLGAEYSKDLKFERVILARELSQREIKLISSRSKIELEIFAHGALCYSFSGMCLFSSYLGGSGANRGICAQPCRRIYKSGKDSKYTFSLKDNQLIEYIPELIDMGIASIKIEGRLKSAEYVNSVAKAYRTAIDNTENLSDAKRTLQLDLGREKTSYFFGGNITKSITNNPETGIYIGKILYKNNNEIAFGSNMKIETGNRLRVRSADGKTRKSVKVKEFSNDENGNIIININSEEIHLGDMVYLVGLRQEKFSSELADIGKTIKPYIPREKAHKLLRHLKQDSSKKSKPVVYLRIDKPGWLRKVRFEVIDKVILKLNKNDWKEFDIESRFIQKNKHKIIIELPKFISEKEIEFYRNLIINYKDHGFKNFMISHLSQKLLIPANSIIYSNENVYVYNDAASTLLKNQGIVEFMYPLENDYENMLESSDRSGIVAIYFYPDLFYSRMPVQLNKQDESFSDDMNYKFRREIRNGITTIIPDVPVSLTHYREKLISSGFNKFLIDFSGERISKNIFQRVLNKYRRGEQIQPSNTFNFKKGLK